jgi:hypothetical protein
VIELELSSVKISAEVSTGHPKGRADLRRNKNLDATPELGGVALGDGRKLARSPKTLYAAESSGRLSNRSRAELPNRATMPQMKNLGESEMAS